MLFLILLAFLFPATAYAMDGRSDFAVVYGVATVTDGDTIKIEVDGKKFPIRLLGVNAPELDETCRLDGGKTASCGEIAAGALRLNIGIVGNADKVACHLTGDVSYKRFVARCSVGGVDLGALMISDGYARAHQNPKWGGGYYKIEAKARAERKGIWSYDALPDSWKY